MHRRTWQRAPAQPCAIRCALAALAAVLAAVRGCQTRTKNINKQSKKKKEKKKKQNKNEGIKKQKKKKKKKQKADIGQGSYYRTAFTYFRHGCFQSSQSEYSRCHSVSTLQKQSNQVTANVKSTFGKIKGLLSNENEFSAADDEMFVTFSTRNSLLDKNTLQKKKSTGR